MMTGTRKLSATDKTGTTTGTRRSSAPNRLANSGASRRASRSPVRIHASAGEDDSGALAGGDSGTMSSLLEAQDAGVGGVGRLEIRKRVGWKSEGLWNIVSTVRAGRHSL